MSEIADHGRPVVLLERGEGREEREGAIISSLKYYWLCDSVSTGNQNTVEREREEGVV